MAILSHGRTLGRMAAHEGLASRFEARDDGEVDKDGGKEGDAQDAFSS